jgi:hypothetical protein
MEEMQDPFVSSDKHMVWALLARNKQPARVELDDSHNMVYYFSAEDVSELVAQLMGCADKVMVSIADVWRAEMTWIMNLRQLTGTRRKPG